MDIQKNTRLLTTREVALKLGIHPKVVTRWIKAHGLPYYRIGATLRFNEDEIDAWLATFKCESEFHVDQVPDDLFEERRAGLGNRN